MREVGIANPGIHTKRIADVEFVQHITCSLVRIQMRLFARIELGVAALGINAVRLEIMMCVINSPLYAVQVVGIITPLNFSSYVLDSTGQREFKSLLLGTK